MNYNESDTVEKNNADPKHLEVLEYIQMHPINFSKHISDLETLIGYENSL